MRFLRSIGMFWMGIYCLQTLQAEPLCQGMKQVVLVAPFKVRDLFIFQEDLKKIQVDLTVCEDIPSASKVFFEPNQAEKVVIFNTLLPIRALKQIDKKKLVYFLWEPWEIPEPYYDFFDRVYTWDDDRVDNVKFFKIHYPTLLPMEQNLIPFQERGLCVMVAGSDVEPQGRNKDLYSERLRMVEFFETKPKGEFAVYGRDWKRRFYRDYMGEIPGYHSGPEKISTLKKYRFSLCFENTRDLNGYITEKIFCCFAAGCVPVYWGAKNVTSYIPKDCFIDYRDFNSREELYLFLKNMKEEEYQQYLTNIRLFLQSDQAKVFTPAFFQKQFWEFARL